MIYISYNKYMLTPNCKVVSTPAPPEASFTYFNSFVLLKQIRIQHNYCKIGSTFLIRIFFLICNIFVLYFQEFKGKFEQSMTCCLFGQSTFGRPDYAFASNVSLLSSSSFAKLFSISVFVRKFIILLDHRSCQFFRCHLFL